MLLGHTLTMSCTCIEMCFSSDHTTTKVKRQQAPMQGSVGEGHATTIYTSVASNAKGCRVKYKLTRKVVVSY